MNPAALHKIGYGMYVIGSRMGDRLNAQIANTVFQITSDPPTVAVSINKKNLTHEFIKASGVFTASVICQDADLAFIGRFGFKSGRDADKLQGVNYRIGQTKAPIVLDNAVSYLEVKVTREVDMGTHTIFIGDVVDAEVLMERVCMTYAYYHDIKRGVTPPTAPSFIKDEKRVEPAPAAAPAPASPASAAPAGQKHRCTVCGYIYDPAEGDADSGIKPGTLFEDLPAGWVCPVCGADKSAFEKI